MDPKTAWWQRLSAAQKPKPSPPDDPRSQEDDEETRKLIAHYLHLADLLLSTEKAQETEEDESSAA